MTATGVLNHLSVLAGTLGCAVHDLTGAGKAVLTANVGDPLNSGLKDEADPRAPDSRTSHKPLAREGKE